MTAPLGRRTRRVAELEADAAMLDDLRALLAADGIHHFMLRTDVLLALAAAETMAGNHDAARARQAQAEALAKGRVR